MRAIIHNIASGDRECRLFFVRFRLKQRTGMNLVMTLIEAIALIVGAVSPEEVTESERERLVWRSLHPLNINSASRRALSESGLFSDFQVVSLLDYISSAGAVLSRSELSVVDGPVILRHFRGLAASGALGV